MFEQYTYKQKFFALLVLFVLLGITAYKRSFKNLIAIYSEHGELDKKAKEMNAISGNSATLHADLVYYDRILGVQGVAKDIIQQEIVGFSAAEKGISIYDLRPVHSFFAEEYVINTNQLDVTGQANGLLKLAYAFETRFKHSRVTSLNFYKAKKNNTIEALHLKLFFQNYGNIK